MIGDVAGLSLLSEHGNVQLMQLLLVDRGRRARQRALRLRGLRERDDVPDGRRACHDMS
jgi:hypothetical protein